MINWRPIETLPTDGREILLWIPGSGVYVAEATILGSITEKATHWAPVNPPDVKGPQ